MKSEKKRSVFETLSAINVNEHTKTYGNGLTYLSSTSTIDCGCMAV